MDGSEDTDLNALWAAALLAYEQETKHKPSEGLALQELNTPDDLIRVLETKSANFHDFRDRHRKVWTQLNNVVAPIARLGKIAQGAASMSPVGPAASAVLGSVVILLTACEDVTSAYDWIESLFEELQSFSERLALYAEGQLDSVMERRVTAILVFFLRVIGKSELLIKDKRFKRYLRSVFLGTDSKTKTLLDDLNRETKGELDYIVASIYSLSRRTLTITESIEQKQKEDTATIMQTLRDSVKESADVDFVKRVLLHEDAATAVQKMLSTIEEQLLPGSADWLEQDDLYQLWLDRKTPILWVFGGPGSGKSHLMARTLQHLENQPVIDSSNNTSVAYFFVKEGRASQQDPQIILKTWAWQIAQMDPIYAQHVAKCCNGAGDLGGTKDVWKRLFLDFYRFDKNVAHSAVLLLDGLDEAPTQARCKVLGLMEKLSLSARTRPDEAPRIQVAVFSRPDIRSDMWFMMQEKYVQVTSAKNSGDIRDYIKTRLETFHIVQSLKQSGPKGHKEASKIARKIMKKVLEGANGIFLWAQLMLQEMERKDQHQIFKTLERPPRGLDDVISKVFDRIASDGDLDQADVSKMLRWLAFAFRDLSFAELRVAMSLPPSFGSSIAGEHLEFVPKPLLLANIRGKLGSIINIKYDLWSTKTPIEVKDPESLWKLSGVNKTTGRNMQTPLDFGDSDDAEESESESDSESAIDDHESNDSSNYHGQTDKVVRLHMARRAASITEYNREYLVACPSEHLSASVSFTHLRIRGFLIEQNTGVDATPLISIDVGQAHAEMAIDCIRMLRMMSTITADVTATPHYPSLYLLHHLEVMNPSFVDSSLQSIIFNGLVWVFGSEIGSSALLSGAAWTDNMNAFAKTLLRTNRYTKSVQLWLEAGAANNNSLDETTKAWVAKATTSVQDLLRHVNLSAVRLWVATPRPRCVHELEMSWYIYIALSVLSMNADGIVPETRIPDWDVARLGFNYTLSQEHIIEAAESAPLEKDSTWHINLGIILWDCGHSDSAIEHFSQAAELDPKNHVINEALSKCYIQKRDLVKASQQIALAEVKLSGTNSQHVRFYLDRAQLILDSFEAGLTNVKDGTATVVECCEASVAAIMKQDRPDYNAVLECVDILDRVKRPDLVIKILRDLGNTNAIGNSTHLDRFLMHPVHTRFSHIGRAVAGRTDAGFVADAFDASWQKRASKYHPSYFPSSVAVASFRYLYTDEPLVTSMQRFERLQEIFKHFTLEDQGVYASYLGTVAHWLCYLHFDQAVSAATHEEAEMHASKLKNAAVALAAETEKFGLKRHLIGSLQYPALLYGRWLRVYAKASPSEWRKWIQPRILTCLSMLVDEDPTNDHRALPALAAALFHAGDRINAAAVMAAVFIVFEDNSKITTHDMKRESTSASGVEFEESSIKRTKSVSFQDSEQELGRSPTGPLTPDKLNTSDWDWNWWCDLCDTSVRQAEEMWFCDCCLDMNFCGPCKTLIAQGSSKTRLCNRGHDTYRAWPVPEEAKDVAVYYSDGVMKLNREWLRSILAEWSTY